MFGVLLGAPTLKLRGDYLAIVTLGFGEIIRIFLNNLSQPVNITNGPQGPVPDRPVPHRQLQLRATRDDSRPRPHRTGEVLLLLPGGPHRGHGHQYAPAGLAHRSRVGGHPRGRGGARAMGINTRNIKLLAFAMGASFGGIAGGMFSAIQGFISRNRSSWSSP
jgi:branched-chain amino acid transport system permease protein